MDALLLTRGPLSAVKGVQVPVPGERGVAVGPAPASDMSPARSAIHRIPSLGG